MVDGSRVVQQTTGSARAAGQGIDSQLVDYVGSYLLNAIENQSQMVIEKSHFESSDRYCHDAINAVSRRSS